MSLNSSVRLNCSAQGEVLQRPERPPGMSLDWIFFWMYALAVALLHLKEKTLYPFLQRTNIVFRVLALMKHLSLQGFFLR